MIEMTSAKPYIFMAVLAGVWYLGSKELAYFLGMNFWEMRLFRIIMGIVILSLGAIVIALEYGDDV